MTRQNQPKLTDFWLMRNGKRLRSQLCKLPSLDQLSPGEQLFAALLRGDRNECVRLLSAHALIALEILPLIEQAKFAGLVLERLFDLGLAQMPEAHPIFRKVSQLAVHETATAQMVDTQFHQLLELLAGDGEHVLWLKGTALARIIYQRTEFRSGADFDLLVSREAFPRVAERLLSSGFNPIMTAAFCNQFGVGPVTTPDDLLLAPTRGWVPVSPISFVRGNWPTVDLKLSATDRGIASEAMQIFPRSQHYPAGDKRFHAPDLLYNLLIACRNLEKDRFVSWKTLYDVHILSQEIGVDRSQWQDFVRLCCDEHVESSAWSSLWLAQDRLHTAVPSFVMSELAPSNSLWLRLALFTAAPSFVWNAHSLPMLILNASVSSDCNNKLALLVRSVAARPEFLSAYYNNRKPLNFLTFFCFCILHWLTLIMPGGAVRRAFGRNVWGIASARQASEARQIEKTAVSAIKERT